MRETMNVIPTREGEILLCGFRRWRLARIYLCGRHRLPAKVETPEQFYESAYAFGNFQRLLADYPADTLHETIANFHNTVWRYENFEKRWRPMSDAPKKCRRKLICKRHKR